MSKSPILRHRCVWALTLVMFSSSCLACMCVETSLENHYRRADSVFLAEIVALDLPQSTDPAGITRADYRVVETFKGLTVYPRLETDRSTCSFGFTAGRRYVVFTDPNGYVSLCSGTHIASGIEAGKTISKLKVFQKDTRLSEPWQFGHNHNWCALGALIRSSSAGAGRLLILATKSGQGRELSLHVTPPQLSRWSSTPTTIEVAGLRIPLDSGLSLGSSFTSQLLRVFRANSFVTVGPLEPDLKLAGKLGLAASATASLRPEVYGYTGPGDMSPAKAAFTDCMNGL